MMRPVSPKTSAIVLLIAFTFFVMVKVYFRQSSYINSRIYSRYEPRSKDSSQRFDSSRQEPYQYERSESISGDASIYTAKRRLISIANQTTPPLLSNYKNPCWAGPGTNITCIPYVMLAGFPKCASTDLHIRLIKHPLVVKGLKKESHYFTKEIYYKDPCPQEQPQDPKEASCLISDYAHTWFGEAAQVIQGKAEKVLKDNRTLKEDLVYPNTDIQEAFARVKEKASKEFEHPMITIDSSISYAWHNDYWRQLAENEGCDLPRALNVDLIAKMNPNVKVIMIMRDPVERLFSEYFYLHARKATTEKFHNLTVEFLKSFDECLQAFSFTNCLLRQTEQQLLRPHVGIYHFHIRDWLGRLPRDQFLFLHFETYESDIDGELKKVFDFLGFPPIGDQATHYIATLKEHNINPTKPRIMYPETRALLNKFYAEHNKQLADLLDDDRLLWSS